MTKRNSIIVAVLLIGSAVLIRTLMKSSNAPLDWELVGFFTGILFGAGVAILVGTFFKRKK